VLDQIKTITFNKTVQNRITGEALFLRAYYYFLLTQVFGDVPLYTTIETPDRLRIPRDGVSAIYIQILADLDLAATYLPIQYGAADVGRATQGAAMALAAKINIYQKNWTKALEYIAKVKHTNLELGIGNSINQWWYSKKIVGGYGFAEVTASFVASFEVDDPRRKNTIVMNNEDYFGVVYKNSFSSTRYSPRKYLQADSTVTQKADGDINYTAIRYAEVLLWEAEALTALDRTAEAIVPLEVVRARARKLSDHPLTALPKVTTTDKQIMTAAIRHERQVELGLEMHRFFDLVRWGTASTTLPGFQAGKHEVFPLPQIEIDLNTKLIQNPGY